jgi:hypothetical protein
MIAGALMGLLMGKNTFEQSDKIFSQKLLKKDCQEQIELSGFVANELSAFSVLHEGSILRTGGERRMFAFLASYSCAGVIHSHSPAAFAEHGGKWLWIALSVRLPLLLV